MAAYSEAKDLLLAQLRAQIASDLEALTESQRVTQEGATHEESRAESSKDTRATETSYLARGLAERVAKLSRAAGALAHFEPRRFSEDDEVALGALVTLEDEEGADPRLYFLAPVAGGIELEWEGRRVRTITPTSPIGRALIGRRREEELQIATPRGLKRATIASLE